MSIAKALELRKQRAKLVTDAQALIAKEGVSAEDRTNFDRMMADADLLKADIDRNERSAALAAELTATAAQARVEDPIVGAEDDAKKVKAAIVEYRTAVRRAKGPDPLALMKPESRSIAEGLQARFFDAMKEYLRMKDAHNLSAETRAILGGQLAEFRDMGVGTGSLGGYLVPQGFVYDVENAMKYFGDMLATSTIMDTATGNLMPYPTDNDTSNKGELVGEGVQVSDQDVTIGQINFNAWKFSTKMVKLSIELLQDSAFDLETFLKNKFAERLGRALNTYFTTGTGTSQPMGVLTAATAGVVAVGSSANTGGAETGGSSIGTKDFSALEHSVDKAYRQGAIYVMHDLTELAVKEVLDKYGRPIWQAGLAVNAPDTINGYQVSINNDMPTIALNAQTVLFGQLKKYTIRRVKELAIVKLSERYADYGQVAFLGFARYDGQLMDAGTHPVKYLAQAAA
jgi:HK97 family phage major capsid protein